MLELEDWRRKQQKMKEDEEYKQFCNSFKSEASDAYNKYCKYIDENSPWPDFKERLEQLHNEIETNSDIYKNTRLKDIFPQWIERNGKNTVYDFLIKHHLPMIITTSDISSVVFHGVQYGVYSYKKEPYIETGSQDCVQSWWQTFSGKSTIKHLEDYFHCTFLEYVNVPERVLRPYFNDYSRRYIESCVYNSQFSYKLKDNDNQRVLTKERLRILLEASYAMRVYHERRSEYIQKYGHILLGDILKDDEFSSVKEKTLGDYLSRCFLLDIDIEYKNNRPRELSVSIKMHAGCGGSSYSNDIIPRINEALNINIDYSDDTIDYVGGWSTYYTFSNDVYYAREDFRFLSLEEVSGFDKDKMKFKPTMWYYKEIMSWDK